VNFVGVVMVSNELPQWVLDHIEKRAEEFRKEGHHLSVAVCAGLMATLIAEQIRRRSRAEEHDGGAKW
jgi:hypothetical protein